MSITKRDAAKLVDEITRTKILGHTIARRSGTGNADSCFLGGLEIVLQNFLRSQGCLDAAAALPAAMNKPPTDAEIAARNAQLDSYRTATGAAHG